MNSIEYERECYKYKKLKKTSEFRNWRKEQFSCQHNKCAWCQMQLLHEYDDANRTEIDHIKPIYDGGKSLSKNMVLSCRRCNSDKSARSGFIRPAWIKDNYYSHSVDVIYRKISEEVDKTGIIYDYDTDVNSVQEKFVFCQDDVMILKDQVDCLKDIKTMTQITGDKCEITFKNNKKYTYNTASIIIEPIKKRISKECLVENNGTIKSNIKEIAVADHYSKILYNTNFVETLPNENLKIIGSCLEKPENRKKFDYIKEVVNKVSDLGLKNDQDENILKKYFNEITYIREDVVLNDYLTGSVKGWKVTNKPKCIIFPFGFNESQQKAVENALTNKISIIQGPPGTGKTNTILNIISNIAANGQTAAVVSNNNSATDNVYEKLEKYKYDFIAARLGKRENKEKFIREQSQIDEDMLTDWGNIGDKEMDDLQDELNYLSEEINKIFDTQKNLSEWRRIIEEVAIEQKHFEQTIKINKYEPVEQMFNNDINSAGILRLWSAIEKYISQNKKSNIFRRLFLNFFYRTKLRIFKKYDWEALLTSAQLQYYKSKKSELSSDIEKAEKFLKKHEVDKTIKSHSELSDKIFKRKIAEKYIGKQRGFYADNDLWRKSEQFVKDYPIILSTAYSLRKSLNPNFVYDYIIIDESSQLNLATFILAISCAKRLILVGDEKQLPNIITSRTRIEEAGIFLNFHIPAEYRYSTNSALTSVIKIFGDSAPQQMLREHYRCDPKIINFCSKQYYDGQLLIMTKNAKNQAPLNIYYTVAGNHARDREQDIAAGRPFERFNQRQIDVIFDEIIKKEQLNLFDGSVGIISPYRKQAAEITKRLKEIGAENTKSSTVDSFQGKERDNIIISTVDNNISDFVSNPNRLNVAVSRAKKRLFLVINGNENASGTDVGDLIDYIKYNNGEETKSLIRSIFDNLYGAYYEYRANSDISKYKSENLMCDLLIDIMDEYEGIDFEFQYRLSLLCDVSKLSERELQYANDSRTKVDFVIYKKTTKRPILAIEVDGWKYHHGSPCQEERDILKNNILKQAGMPLLRLSTTESNEKQKIEETLNQILRPRTS